MVRGLSERLPDEVLVLLLRLGEIMELAEALGLSPIPGETFVGLCAAILPVAFTLPSLLFLLLALLGELSEYSLSIVYERNVRPNGKIELQNHSHLCHCTF